MSDPLLVVRSVEESDWNYIYETWLADLRDADASFVPNDIWFPAHREVLRRVLSGIATDGACLRERCKVFVLADAEAPDGIIGYLVRDSAHLHWIHIRRGTKWRNRGLAKRLLLETNSQHLPLVWRTKLGHERLHNQLRSRQARHAWWSTATPSPS